MENVDEIRICPDDEQRVECLDARATSYIISNYLTSTAPGAIRSLYKLQATNRTMVVFEGANKRAPVPSSDHAHPTKWFQPWSQDPNLVTENILKEIQLDQHLESSQYLYADAHVDAITAMQVHAWAMAGFDFAKPE